MAGLIFLAALAALVALLVWLSGLLTRGLRGSQDRRFMVRVLIVLGAFPLMLADEIIGKYQFEALCKANGIESIDVSIAAGKNVRVKYSDRTLIHKVIMPIYMSDVVFSLEGEDLPLFKYKNYYAKGGWIMRYTPVNMGSPQPMFFNGNGCGFGPEDRIFSKNHIVVIN